MPTDFDDDDEVRPEDREEDEDLDSEDEEDEPEPAQQEIIEPVGLPSSDWYLLEGFLDKHGNIHAAGIPAEGLQVNKPRNVAGIVFPREYYKQVLGVIGKEESDFALQETERRSIYFLNLLPEQPLTKFGGNLEQWPCVETTLKDWAMKMDTRIHVRCPHGEAVPPENNPKILHVRFYSAPNKAAVANEASRVYGLALSAGNNGCKVIPASPVGVVIKDPMGVDVAEYVENTLYFYHDLLHSDGRSALLIVDRVFEELRFIKIDPSTYAVRKATQERDTLIERYLSAVSHRSDRILRDNEVRIRQLNAEIVNLTSSIGQKVQATSDLQKEKEYWSTRKPAKEDVLREIESFRSVAGVELVTMPAQTMVRVHTEHIYMDYVGELYSLGKMFLDFNITDQGNSLSIRLQAPRRQGITQYPHPHVLTDGTVCFGNLSTGVAKLLAQYEFATLTNLVLPFLRTCNNESRYVDPHHFPRATKEEEEVWRAKYKPQLKEAA